MDGWGSLTMLIKRQNSDKNRKAELKYQLQKRKESFVKDAYDKEGDEFDFPEISKHQMELLKKEIRRDIRNQRLRSILSYLIVTLAIVIFFALAFFTV